MPAKRKVSALHRKKGHSGKKPGNQKVTLEEERTLFLKEQTILAKERTILSFMRTGLGFVTVGFGIIAAGTVLEQFISVDLVTSFILGSAVIGIGFFEIIESVRRLKNYRDKMRKVARELGEENV